MVGNRGSWGFEHLRSRFPVEPHHPSILAGHRNHVSSVSRSVKRGCGAEIPVMVIARRVLVVPVQSSRGCVQRNDSIGIDVVARPD